MYSPPPSPLPIHGEGEQTHNTGINKGLKPLVLINHLSHAQKYLPYILSLFILLLAFAARFHWLGGQSLWHDEGNAYVQSLRSFPNIAYNAALDIHPPGYYWLLAIWHGLSGRSEFALRALSAFAGVLTIAFTYALGRRLFGAFAGLAAALLVALNSFSIYYGQEARMYALLALWSAAGMWALVQFLNHKNAKNAKLVQRGLVLALVNVAGLWTHYAYPFVMLAQGVMAVLWFGSFYLTPSPSPARRGEPRQNSFAVTLNTIRQRGFSLLGYYVAANLLTIALYLPWLPIALNRVTTWPSTGEQIATNDAIVTIFGCFTFGVTYQQSSSAAMFGIVLFLLLFGLLVARTNSAEKVQADVAFRVPTWWRMLLPVLWVIVPVGLFLVLGLFREENLKFLLPAQIGFALWVARGLWVLWEGYFAPIRTHHIVSLQTRQRILRFASLVALFWLVINLFAGLNPLYTAEEFQRDNYRAIVAEIEAAALPGDVIILDAPNQEEVFRYYYDGDLPIVPLPAGLGGDDAATQTAVQQLISDYDRVFVLFWGEAERDPQRVVESTLNANAFEASDQWYGDVRFVRYATPVDDYAITQDVDFQFGEAITLERYALSSDTLAPGDVLQVQLNWRTSVVLDARYVVSVQLLKPDGTLAAQHDSEPGGGLNPTNTWTPDMVVIDNHGLSIPNDLLSAHYTLIIALYDSQNPQQRLPVGSNTFVELGTIILDQPLAGG